ncbi:MAG TPA: ABC transporter substrate-binding protein [Stellaceae bacterium]|nr:ABC transporter substrate-binding protein [Stellaceae bacterium]
MGKIRAFLWAALASLALGYAAPVAADTVKVGVILPYTGPFASLASIMDDAIKLWMKQNGDSVGSTKIEIIRRDSTGPNPDVAKRLAQELITRDGVQILTGFVFTPNALAVAPLATEAKIPTVIMNAATAVITTKSPYFARVSLTIPQTTEIFGRWAATDGGMKRAFTSVSDYGPGYDAEESFKRGFTEAGGIIVGSVRVPLANPDVVPFLQRVLDQKPDALYAFIPGGTQPPAFVKAFNEVGLAKAGIKLMPSEEATEEATLQDLGDLAVGLVTAMHYTAAHPSATNKAFVSAWHAAYGDTKDPDFFAVSAWDGMALIYDIVKQLDGKIDGDKAMEIVKGWKHESPRGPISIDPETRDIVQNVYICRVQKVNGRLANVEFETYEAVKDPWKQRNK